MADRLFLDTALAIALANPKDQFHSVSLRLSETIAEKGHRLVTTSAVLLEIGNSLAKQRFRDACVRLMDSLQNDENVEIVSFSTSLFDAALALFQNRMDKEWSLTDCISFVVMEQFGIPQALTPDNHFEQAGFIALMKEV